VERIDINSGKEDIESNNERHDVQPEFITSTNGKLTSVSPSIGDVDGPAPSV
jgi:hypothetical protein